MTSHVFSCRPTLVLVTLRSLRFNKILRDGNEWLTGLSSLTSGSLCLVSFSESLTSCLRKPPGRTDRGGCGTVVTIGLFSSFICSLVHWWFRQNKQNRKSLYGLDAVCSPLGMHIRHALHAQRRVKQVRCIRWQCMTNVLESERDFLQFLSNTLFWPTLKHEFIKTAPQGLE